LSICLAKPRSSAMGAMLLSKMAEVAIPRHLFADILRLIAELRPPPAASTA
jgi:hypothetical protein